MTNYGHHVYYLCFNMRREPLDADAVRQAMAHLVVRDRIVTELLQSSVLPLASFLPPSSSFYKEDVPARSYDPARAAEILDQAGYTVDIVTKTRRDPATRKPMREMSILAPSGSVGPSIANLIANECRAIGLPVKALSLNGNDMFAKADKHEFDMYVAAYSLSRFPTSLYGFFHSSQRAAGGYNKSGIKDPQLDKALEEIYYAPDLHTAKEAADKAQVILASGSPG